MKFVLVPILIALLLIQTFSQWMVIAEYNLNKDYIAKNLCINRAKPKLQCKGKCQMMKKLAEEEQQNSSAPSPAKIKIPETSFYEPVSEILFACSTLKKTIYPPEPKFLKYTAPLSTIFHPPAVS